MDIMDLIFTQQVLEVLTGAVIELLTIAVGFIIAWAGLAARQYIKDKDNALKLSEKEHYAKLAVQAVESALKNFNSEEKFEAAKASLVKLANANNIPIKESELDSLIDSAVLDLKAEGKEIKKTYDEQLELPLEDTEG